MKTFFTIVTLVFSGFGLAQDTPKDLSSQLKASMSSTNDYANTLISVVQEKEEANHVATADYVKKLKQLIPAIQQAEDQFETDMETINTKIEAYVKRYNSSIKSDLYDDESKEVMKNSGRDVLQNQLNKLIPERDLAILRLFVPVDGTVTSATTVSLEAWYESNCFSYECVMLSQAVFSTYINKIVKNYMIPLKITLDDDSVIEMKTLISATSVTRPSFNPKNYIDEAPQYASKGDLESGNLEDIKLIETRKAELKSMNEVRAVFTRQLTILGLMFTHGAYFSGKKNVTKSMQMISDVVMNICLLSSESTGSLYQKRCLSNEEKGKISAELKNKKWDSNFVSKRFDLFSTTVEKAEQASTNLPMPSDMSERINRARVFNNNVGTNIIDQIFR